MRKKLKLLLITMIMIVSALGISGAISRMIIYARFTKLAKLCELQAKKKTYAVNQAFDFHGTKATISTLEYLGTEIILKIEGVPGMFEGVVDDAFERNTGDLYMYLVTQDEREIPITGMESNKENDELVIYFALEGNQLLNVEDIQAVRIDDVQVKIDIK